VEKGWGKRGGLKKHDGECRSEGQKTEGIGKGAGDDSIVIGTSFSGTSRGEKKKRHEKGVLRGPHPSCLKGKFWAANQKGKERTMESSIGTGTPEKGGVPSPLITLSKKSNDKEIVDEHVSEGGKGRGCPVKGPAKRTTIGSP